MATEALYARTYVCYVSWKGKYVSLDTSSGTPRVTLEPPSWRTYKKHQIRIYQYDLADSPWLACVIRCHDQHGHPHLVHLSGVSTDDIEVKSMPPEFDAVILNDANDERFLKQVYYSGFKEQTFSPIANPDHFLSPNVDLDKLIVGDEPFSFQVYPYVAFIEQTTAFIMLSQTKEKNDRRAPSDDSTNPESTSNVAETTSNGNPYALATLQLGEMAANQEMTEKQKELELNDEATPVGETTKGDAEEGVFLTVTQKGALMAKAGKPQDSDSFSMYKYSYTIGEDRKIATVLYHKKTKMALRVSDEKYGMQLSLEKIKDANRLSRSDLADDKFFIITDEKERNVGFIPHEDMDKNISLRRRRQESTEEKEKSFDVVLTDMTEETLKSSNRFNIETLDSISCCYKFWCFCCLRCNCCCGGDGQYV